MCVKQRKRLSKVYDGMARLKAFLTSSYFLYVHNWGFIVGFTMMKSEGYILTLILSFLVETVNFHASKFPYWSLLSNSNNGMPTTCEQYVCTLIKFRLSFIISFLISSHSCFIMSSNFPIADLEEQHFERKLRAYASSKCVANRSIDGWVFLIDI